MRPPRSEFLSFVAAALALSLAAPLAAETPPAVGLTLDGMSYVLSRAGVVDFQIEAKRAEISPSTGRIELIGVRARVGDVRGESPELSGLELVCQRGSLDLEAREFVAVGGVDGRLRDGRTLRTERLRYRHDRGIVTSDAPVVLRDETGDFTGGGLQLWVRGDRFRLTGGARIVQGE